MDTGNGSEGHLAAAYSYRANLESSVEHPTRGPTAKTDQPFASLEAQPRYDEAADTNS